MVRTSGFHCPDSIPGQKTEIPQATGCGQKGAWWGENREGSRDDGFLALKQRSSTLCLFSMNKTVCLVLVCTHSCT